MPPTSSLKQGINVLSYKNRLQGKSTEGGEEKESSLGQREHHREM